MAERENERTLSITTFYRKLSYSNHFFGGNDKELIFTTFHTENPRPLSGKQARQMRSARIKSGMDPKREDMVPDADFYK